MAEMTREEFEKELKKTTLVDYPIITITRDEMYHLRFINRLISDNKNGIEQKRISDSELLQYIYGYIHGLLESYNA